MLPRLFFPLLALSAVADLYLHSPPGSNNRNRERNDNRANANRLFDSQNNGKGGYPYRGDPSLQGVGDPLTYYAGSELQIEWTNQHGCGPNPNIYCHLVIQVGIVDTMPGLRDGYPNSDTCYDSAQNNQNTNVDCDSTETWTARKFERNNNAGTNTIPDPRNDGDSDTEKYNKYVNGAENYIEYGLHENHLDYKECYTTERNKGLYTSDQKLNGNAAIYTRQNPNGNRRGLECPEERDYYPYWRKTSWIDVAVLTSDTKWCEFFQTQSANVRGYSKCTCPDAAQNNPCPITQAACNARGGTWSEDEPYNWPPPECIYHPFNRDNHLGNSYPVDKQTGAFLQLEEGMQPEASMYNWIIPPQLAGQDVVLRLRYNMSTADYDSQAYADPSNAACNNVEGGVDKNNCGVGTGVNQGENCPYVTVDTQCNDGDPDCDATSYDGQKPECYNSLTRFSVPLYNRPYINLFDKDVAASEGFKLGIAINTHQTGRTFEDRSYVFKVANSPVAQGITNLGLRGRRGNIVQSYPSVEYDFTPSNLVCNRFDYVHIQFHGSDFNAAKNANNGEGWQYSDRTNIVEMWERAKNYPKHHSEFKFFNDQQAEYWAWVGQDPKTMCDTTIEDDQNNNQNDFKNCGKLNRMANRFPANPQDGLVQCTAESGTYSFMSTRNNNFSNRSQKGQIHVKSNDEDQGLTTAQQVAVSFAVIFFVGAMAAGGQ
mmetsp:Transcript_18795/g.28161  ORF Transcript_18795/g.28161 Transcript_18795/m.28161 type:complete len:711 (-) Transcript_18795:355-2487(-)